MELHKLSEKQIKKVVKIIHDDRARYIEIPSPKEISEIAKEGKDTVVNILQWDGKIIGNITIPQAFKL